MLITITVNAVVLIAQPPPQNSADKSLRTSLTHVYRL